MSAITVEPGTGGVAEVSRLLWSVCRQAWGDDLRLITLCPGKAGQPTWVEKARFVARLGIDQAFGRCSWILHSHLSLARSQAAVPARLRRPYAVFLHGIEAWGRLSSRDERSLKGATLRLANSDFTARRVMERHPGVGPVVACPLALLPGDGREGDTGALPWRIGDAAVLIVGRMLSSERYKGHDQLIDAFPLVVQHVPQAQLIVVGTGDDAERLRDRARQGGAADRIVFTGFVSGAVLEALYERCSLFAMPSLNEGFGLVYLEAMAHRLPCIGSRADAAPEVIADGATGILVDQSDVLGLAAEILRLLRDRELRARMGEAGARRVRECFSYERFASQVTRCLREAFERRHSSGSGLQAPTSGPAVQQP